jgi:hypothetical protein
MFKEDKYLIYYALHMWANHIETGNIYVSELTAAKYDKQHNINSLTKEQKEFVLRLRKLAKKQLIN